MKKYNEKAHEDNENNFRDKSNIRYIGYEINDKNIDYSNNIGCEFLSILIILNLFAWFAKDFVFKRLISIEVLE